MWVALFDRLNRKRLPRGTRTVMDPGCVKLCLFSRRVTGSIALNLCIGVAPPIFATDAWNPSSFAGECWTAM